MGEITDAVERTNRRLAGLMAKWRARKNHLEGEVLSDALQAHIEALEREIQEYEDEGEADYARAEAEAELLATRMAEKLWGIHLDNMAALVEQLHETARGRVAREVESRWPGTMVARDLRGE